MNIPVHENRNSSSFEAPTCKPGQYVVLRAEMDIMIVFSACPQDVLKINCGRPSMLIIRSLGQRNDRVGYKF
jgi:uncharacterized protein